MSLCLWSSPFSLRSCFRSQSFPQVVALGVSLLSANIALVAADSSEGNAAPNVARSSDASIDDLTELSLEELHAISISAASKRAEPLFETPAAVTVLLPVDIQRAGASSVAESLRLVPGVHVIQLLPGQWKVGVRGANGIQSTKLLVLVDGRSVYLPFYGGVEWPNADVSMDDLARVEVVRGPGATLWGANAVNGVINVISKDARDTQGGVVSVRSGTAEAAEAHLRFGSRFGAQTWFRVSASARDTTLAAGSLGNDPMDNYVENRVSWRSDTAFGENFQITTQADNLESKRKIYSDTSTHRVSSLLTRLSAKEILQGDAQIQVYFDDSTERTLGTDRGGSASIPISANGDTKNFDLDLTFHRHLWTRHDVIVGGGARYTDDDVQPSYSLSVAHPRSRTWLINYFVQDEIALTPKQWRLTVGTKLEHHASTRYILLPNARLAWLPNSANTFWLAASRAARAPSRGEREALLNFDNVPATATTPAVNVKLAGNPELREEINNAFEAGWRWRPVARFSIDFTSYLFRYQHVRNLDTTTSIEPGVTPTILQLYQIKNDGDASAKGAELSWTWRPSDRWELNGAIGRGVAGSESVANNLLLSADYYVPRWLGHISSWWQLPRDFEFSTTLYGVGENQSANVAGYLRLDAQLLWHPRADLELSIGLQNASDPKHNESITVNAVPHDEVRRNVYGKIQWRF